MSGPAKGGAMHSATLLQNELVRLGDRLERQTSRAQSAFTVDFMAAVQGKPLWLLRMVHNALVADEGNLIVRKALLDAMAGVSPAQRLFLGDLAEAVANDDDEHERETEPPTLAEGLPLPEGIPLPPGLPPPTIVFDPPLQVPRGRVTLDLSGLPPYSDPSMLWVRSDDDLLRIDDGQRMVGAERGELEEREAEGEGLLPDLPSSAYAPDAEPLEPAFRYPEPGEPATVLPDGTVVALDEGG